MGLPPRTYPWGDFDGRDRQVKGAGNRLDSACAPPETQGESSPAGGENTTGLPSETSPTQPEPSQERCGGTRQIWTHRDDGRGPEFNMHPDSTAGSSITQCPGCEDCS